MEAISSSHPLVRYITSPQPIFMESIDSYVVHVYAGVCYVYNHERVELSLHEYTKQFISDVNAGELRNGEFVHPPKPSRGHEISMSDSLADAIYADVKYSGFT